MVVFFYLSIQKTDSRAEKNSSCLKDGRFCSEKNVAVKKEDFFQLRNVMSAVSTVLAVPTVPIVSYQLFTSSGSHLGTFPFGEFSCLIKNNTSTSRS